MCMPAPPPRQVDSPAVPSRAVAWLLIAVLALAIFGLRVATAVNDPFFPGDAGHRMNGSDLPVIRLGNRVWLPVVQMHVWVCHLLGLPSYAFKIVLCFYPFIAVLFLGLIARRLAGPGYLGLAFSLLLMFCFAHQRVLLRLNGQPYQEGIELALFYVLLWAGALELRKSRWLVAIGAAALLTRETFWIYLLAVSLLNWKQIVSQKSYRLAFLVLWSVPALWFLSIPFGFLRVEGRFPRLLVEWPLGINKVNSQAVSSLSTSLGSLGAALISSRAVLLAGSVMLVWALARARRRTAVHLTERSGGFRARFGPFSLISLGVIYSLVILFDPWEHTFANTRMTVPLLAHGFVWAALAFGGTLSHQGVARFLSRTVLVAGMVLSVDMDARNWVPKDHSQARANHAEIERLLKDAAGDRQPRVCFRGVDYFRCVPRLIAPTLYARRRFVGRNDETPGACDVVIAPSGRELPPGSAFVKHKDYLLAGQSFAVYRRSGAP